MEMKVVSTASDKSVSSADVWKLEKIAWLTKVTAEGRVWRNKYKITAYPNQRLVLKMTTEHKLRS